jgi:peptidoglycan/LPS O-acetylase OafA/YrhL
MDFLRSVAILLVILAHSVLSYGAPAELAPLQFGGNGVDLFFVLSGWLLGSQLFKELSTTHHINIPKFWYRRWMRTFPAYYAVLTASVLQRYLTKDSVEFPWQYFVFVQNYHFPLEFFSISWSLCVEEQFYLMIAPLLLLTYRMHRHGTTLVLLVMMIAPFCFRQLGWYDNPKETHVRIDCCVAGILLAQIYRQYPEFWSRITRIAVPASLVALMCYLMFVLGRYFPETGIKDPDKSVLALMFMSWVLVANATDKLRTRLYVPGAYYIATRSYSLYLVHPEALALISRIVPDIWFPAYFVCTLAISCLLAEMLYRFIEKPIMNMRERFDFFQKRGQSVA